MVRRLVCLFRGHVPAYGLYSSLTTTHGHTYFTPCQRCGRVYEQKVTVFQP